jgi:predicted nucleic acid-binding protein
LRVLVDTSAWADFLNGYASPEQAAIAELLDSDHEICTCGIIVAEVFQGLRRDKGRDEIAQLFREMTFLEATGIDLHLRAAEVYRGLRRKGKTIRSTIDCIIATLAEQHECYMLARDRDIETILASGVVKAKLWRFAPPSS